MFKGLVHVLCGDWQRMSDRYAMAFYFYEVRKFDPNEGR